MPKHTRKSLRRHKKGDLMNIIKGNPQLMSILNVKRSMTKDKMITEILSCSKCLVALIPIAGKRKRSDKQLANDKLLSERRLKVLKGDAGRVVYEKKFKEKKAPIKPFVDMTQASSNEKQGDEKLLAVKHGEGEEPEFNIQSFLDRITGENTEQIAKNKSDLMAELEELRRLQQPQEPQEPVRTTEFRKQVNKLTIVKLRVVLQRAGVSLEGKTRSADLKKLVVDNIDLTFKLVQELEDIKPPSKVPALQRKKSF